MAKWVHQYIRENTTKWEKEKMERLEGRRKLIEDWERKSRMEKILVLKEKWKNKAEKMDKAENVEICEDVELNKIAEKEEKSWMVWRRKVEEDKIETKPENKRKREDTARETIQIENIKLKTPRIELKNTSKILKPPSPPPSHSQLWGENEKGGSNIKNMEEFLESEDELELIRAVTEVEAELGVGGQGDEEEPDIGQNFERGMCLQCAYTPCICVLTKLELKLNILRNPKSNQELVQEDNNSKLLGVGGGDIAQNITSVLSDTSPPKSNQEQVQEGKISKLKGVGSGDIAQKITSVLSDTSPPPNLIKLLNPHPQVRKPRKKL